MSDITGGETVAKVVQVSDADMSAIKALESAGIGQRGFDAHAAFNAIVSQRSADPNSPANRYRRFANAARALMTSGDPEIQKAWQAKNDEFKRVCNRVNPGSVHADSFLSSLSTQYGNDEFIGELLAPPVLVSKKSDEFPTYGKRDRLALPLDDGIGDSGDVTEVEETRGSDAYACKDRGFQRSIGATTVANQDAPLDEMFDLVEGLAEMRGLAREIRIANTLTDANNYPTSNKVTLSGADQWNSSAGGAPIAAIQTATAALWRGRAPARTKGFCSLDVYNVLSRHPDVLGLFQYNGQNVGLATPGMIAAFLGLDDLLVGKARYDSDAVNASTPSYARVWGNYFGVLRVADRASLRSATFAMTLRWLMQGVPGANQGILTQMWFEERKGLGGTYVAKVGESEAHKVQASDAGYLISDPIAV
jgi:hypothetical protein